MLDTFLQAIHENPRDGLTWAVLADWLEENGQEDRADLLRLRETLRQSLDVPDRAESERRLQQLIARGTAPVTTIWAPDLSSKVTLPLSLIPAGRFLMGSPEKEGHRLDIEGPQHQVRISHPYYLGVTPVTQAQWTALMRSNPSTFRFPNHPVESVNWQDAMDFCERISSHLGRKCRLPTEAEWEYACRAGTTTTFHTGNGVRAMRLAGWCSTSHTTGSAQRTSEVGRFLPNAFGLYDMHGNVREWCLDDQRTYTARMRVDPRGRIDGRTRIVRGGSWYYSAEDCRAASRYNRPIEYRLDYYGFRVLVGT